MAPTRHFLQFFFLALLTVDNGTTAELEVNATLDVTKTQRTGSWQNCTETPKLTSQENNHPDSAYIVVSCEEIHYRISQASLDAIDTPIIIGILSGAAIKNRRDYIRSTWAYKKPNIFFIVGGAWDKIEDEYIEHGDLVWIDKEEVYITETSVLTLKTESFLSIIYNRIMNTNPVIQYLLKTDDDSYINVQKLHQVLIDSNWDETVDYWGKCHEGRKPHRNQKVEWQKKWFISYDIYPEPEYPPYCQGAGFALSRHFLDCAVGQGHIARVRYMPNEDVAVGMLAERCGIPTVNDDGIWIRWEHEDGITMDDKIIQHYIKTEEEMRLHHKSVTGVLGPI
eukprot:scaffold814_cov248-Chaetoceros_neogracile.AAC.9